MSRLNILQTPGSGQLDCQSAGIQGKATGKLLQPIVRTGESALIVRDATEHGHNLQECMAIPIRLAIYHVIHSWKCVLHKSGQKNYRGLHKHTGGR